MVTAGAVSNDLNSIKTVVNMRILGHPQLFTSLTSDGRVFTLDDSISKQGLLLASNCCNLRVERERAQLFMLPCREPPTLSVVVATGQE